MGQAQYFFWASKWHHGLLCTLEGLLWCFSDIIRVRCPSPETLVRVYHSWLVLMLTFNGSQVRLQERYRTPCAIRLTGTWHLLISQSFLYMFREWQTCCLGEFELMQVHISPMIMILLGLIRLGSQLTDWTCFQINNKDRSPLTCEANASELPLTIFQLHHYPWHLLIIQREHSRFYNKLKLQLFYQLLSRCFSESQCPSSM